MSTSVPIVVVLVGLGGLQAPGGGGQAPQPATRLIEGRVTDVQGHPVREGKIMFALQNPPLAWIPTQKKKPNKSPGFVRYFGYNQSFTAVFWVYLYTIFHVFRCPM
jgi:hypothetical protein